MSKVVTRKIETVGSNETELIGEKLGQRLKGGETIELISDLGGGKTTFVRGLAKGLGSVDKVASPSFTIKREYYTNDLVLHHFDFYRLKEPGLISHDIKEVINQPTNVVVIEWADIVQGALPSRRLTVTIKVVSESKRVLNFSCPEEMSYLLENLAK